MYRFRRGTEAVAAQLPLLLSLWLLVILVAPSMATSSSSAHRMVGDGGFPQPPLLSWPFLKENSPSPPQRVNVQSVQSLCDPPVAIDGAFGTATKACVERLQADVKISADGEVGPSTWEGVFGARLPLGPTSAASTIDAVVRQFNGYYGANLTLGAWTPELEDHVRSWQQAQQLRTPDGRLRLDEFQRLVGGVVPGRGVYGFDIGWPEGSASAASLDCLAKAGFTYAIFECWTESPHATGGAAEADGGSSSSRGDPGGGFFFEPCVGNLERAWAAGFASVSAYFFPRRDGDPTLQAHGMLDALTKAGAKYDKIMIDIEDGWDGLPVADNVKFLTAVVSVFNATEHPVVIYCGRSWPKWYAHYDQIPSYRDWYGQPYGGWKQPAAKQLWDHKDGPAAACGLEIDWEWSDAQW